MHRCLFLLLLCAGAASAETHEILMLNRNETGAMVFAPDHLAIAPGDTVRFVAKAKGHNAAIIDGFLPAGTEPFKGNINEEIKVTLTEPGAYGVKCIPHYAMGMVMLIEVGTVGGVALPENLPKRAAVRFAEILSRRAE